MAQRIALFLEEMEETVSQSMDLADNSENTLKLLRISKETAESLVKVSNYIKTSRQIVEIAEAECRGGSGTRRAPLEVPVEQVTDGKGQIDKG